MAPTRRAQRRRGPQAGSCRWVRGRRGVPRRLGGWKTSLLSQPTQKASPAWWCRSAAQRGTMRKSNTKCSAPTGAEIACCPTPEAKKFGGGEAVRKHVGGEPPLTVPPRKRKKSQGVRCGHAVQWSTWAQGVCACLQGRDGACGGHNASWTSQQGCAISPTLFASASGRGAPG